MAAFGTSHHSVRRGIWSLSGKADIDRFASSSAIDEYGPAQTGARFSDKVMRGQILHSSDFVVLKCRGLR
jgi:hypothetical protein